MGKSARHEQTTGLAVTSEPCFTLGLWRQKRTLGCLWSSLSCLPWPFPQFPKATVYFVRESTGINVCPSVTELNIAKGSRSWCEVDSCWEHFTLAWRSSGVEKDCGGCHRQRGVGSGPQGPLPCHDSGEDDRVLSGPRHPFQTSASWGHLLRALLFRVLTLVTRHSLVRKRLQPQIIIVS